MEKIAIEIEAFGRAGHFLPEPIYIDMQTPVLIHEILQQLSTQYPAAQLVIQQCACAIGDEIVSRQQYVQHSCTLVLLSPVAGG